MSTENVLKAVKREVDRDSVQNQGLSKEDLDNDWRFVRQENGVYEFYVQTGDSFNLGWSVYAFVSDYMSVTNLPELRGIVEWIEGQMVNVEVVDAHI